MDKQRGEGEKAVRMSKGKVCGCLNGCVDSQWVLEPLWSLFATVSAPHDDASGMDGWVGGRMDGDAGGRNAFVWRRGLGAHLLVGRMDGGADE